MLLLIRVRYPALAGILSFLSGLAFIAYGIAAHHPAVAIFSAAKKLTFHNTAFAQLWGLEPAWLADSPAASGSA